MKSIEEVNQLKDLIIDLERKIGGECYNSNIQNYGSWGVWEGEGRDFKYPFNYYDQKNKVKIKKWYMSEDMLPEEIKSSYYAFGANQLHIGRAILNLLECIENRYKINFVELEKNLGEGNE